MAKFTDIEARLAELERTKTPCEKDGHSYTQGCGGAERSIFCQKCGDVKPLGSEKRACGFNREREV